MALTKNRKITHISVQIIQRRENTESGREQRKIGDKSRQKRDYREKGDIKQERETLDICNFFL